MRGTHWGQWYNRPTGCSAVKAPHANFNFFNLPQGQAFSWVFRYMGGFSVHMLHRLSKSPSDIALLHVIMSSPEEEMFAGRKRYATRSLMITDVVNHATTTRRSHYAAR